MALTMKKYFAGNIFLILLLSVPLMVQGQTPDRSSQQQVDKILELGEEPAGVVFEIVTGQNQGLE